jgi:hypothetical protein
MPVANIKWQEPIAKGVNRKLQIREIVITMSETTKQSKFTLMGLLHFVRNDMIFICKSKTVNRKL